MTIRRALRWAVHTCAAVAVALFLAAGAWADDAPALLKAPFSGSEAKAAQSAWAKHLNRQAVEKNSLGEKLLLIPPGEFMMGNQEDIATTLDRFPYVDRKNIVDELPRHRVRITKPFYLGATTITYGNFLTFYHDSGYKTDAERDGKPSWGYNSERKLVQSTTFVFWNTGWEQTYEHPVVYVSWNDAVAFCDWLSRKEGKKYRLPTEAEWEYACRAGTDHRYFWGDDPEDMVHYGNGPDQDFKRWEERDNANITIAKWANGVKTDTQIPYPFLSHRDGYVFTAPVGKFQANAFSLYDMSGNVWQWCSDWHDVNYQNSPTDDPKGPDTGTERVERGGSWRNTPDDCRCAYRNNAGPALRYCELGFRVVREP